jgi:hypothetical protein
MSRLRLVGFLLELPVNYVFFSAKKIDNTKTTRQNYQKHNGSLHASKSGDCPADLPERIGHGNSGSMHD